MSQFDLQREATTLSSLADTALNQHDDASRAALLSLQNEMMSMDSAQLKQVAALCNERAAANPAAQAHQPMLTPVEIEGVLCGVKFDEGGSVKPHLFVPYADADHRIED